MREAFELAWVCAQIQSKGALPEIMHIDDILFLSPVDIGSCVTFVGN